MDFMTYEKEKYLKFLQGIFNITPGKKKKSLQRLPW